jgi:hypothetical protein
MMEALVILGQQDASSFTHPRQNHRDEKRVRCHDVIVYEEINGFDISRLDQAGLERKPAG